MTRLPKIKKGIMIFFSLSVFDRYMTSTVALNGDETFTDRAFSIIVGPFIVDCHIYYFKLVF